MKSVYTYYKERLIEISGKNRSLYAKKISKKYSYDLGKIFDGDYEAIADFVDFLWHNKRYSFPIIRPEDKQRLYKNLGVEQKLAKNYADLEKLNGKEKSSMALKLERQKREELKRAITSQITALKNLKREIEEFYKETGRYELYIGYPFVKGCIGKDTLIKAPLLLFPVKIEVAEDNVVEVEIKRDEPVQLNKVFCLAYAKQHKLNIENIETEFGNNLSARFKDINEVVEYLRKQGFKIGYTARKGLFDFEKGKEPLPREPLEIKQYCVIGRFPMANSIYNDYTLLEKQKLTNEAIEELLYAKKPKVRNKGKILTNNKYMISNLDYAQENAVSSLSTSGNIVVYGPPGTGKSQTIVNIITDAICKNKRVLVVSQKKAALDVVYNRLGTLNNKVMFLIDAEKERNQFYERTKTAHQEIFNSTRTDLDNKYEEINQKIVAETAELEQISNALFSPTEFGLSLQEMYANSYIIGKNSYDYTIYQSLINNKDLMALDFDTLSEALRLIKEKNKAEFYYRFIQTKKANPFVDTLQNDLEFHILNETKAKLQKLLTLRLPPFNFAKYPNSRQLINYYLDNNLDVNSLEPLVKFISKEKNSKSYKTLKTSYFVLPMLPFAKNSVNKKENEIKEEFYKTIEAVNEYTKDYDFLRSVFTPQGYATFVECLLNGNASCLKLVYNALNNYVEYKDLTLTLTQLSDVEKLLLDFAYKISDSKTRYKETLSKILTIRIYHEITVIEKEKGEELAKILDYENIKNRIISLKTEQNNISRSICAQKFTDEYIQKFNTAIDNKNFLYQINKQQNQWAIRKFMEVYAEYMFNLFPCWLLSPEGVSTILPLTKNLFDIVIFDEASQVFIENTLPCIFRGKNIVVAGDSKQLRPTANFIKRYLGSGDDELDLSTQEALEVESLLDLALTRYNSANLTYHYRSLNEELINFSNEVFYDNKLEIAPNTTKNLGKKPIQRIKVEGRWINRKNLEEANAVVEVLKKIFSTRKNNQTIGIITFNAEQESAIEDAIDNECNKNAKFRELILKEMNRKENGQDISLFVKNLENVQGDERDIIIFSIGYAKNEYGKIIAQFGPLSTEGGENRLNVAITRAKEKIYVITSIEPEELNVEGAKNLGPKIFKNYLAYVRAVSNNDLLETQIILEKCRNSTALPIQKHEISNNLEQQIKTELEKLGYKVEINVGNAKYKISLAIYDRKIDKYLLGVECDYTAYKSSPSIIERDVFRPNFLKSRGWNIVRIWSRDWWLHKQRVINNLVKLIEKAKQKYSSPAKPTKPLTPNGTKNRIISIKSTSTN